MRIKIFQIVKSAIDEWDPYELLSDFPQDEYDSESIMISSQIKKESSIEEMAIVISNVFSKQFSEEDFPVENCIIVAKNLKRLLESIE